MTLRLSFICIFMTRKIRIARFQGYVKLKTSKNYISDLYVANIINKVTPTFRKVLKIEKKWEEKVERAVK